MRPTFDLSLGDLELDNEPVDTVRKERDGSFHVTLKNGRTVVVNDDRRKRMLQEAIDALS